MTSRLDRLEGKGLIERVAHPTDRRSTEVALTEEGLSLTDRAVSEHVRREAELISSLTDEQQAQLDSLARILLAGLEARRVA
jgi:DNA-binding MarR family transcriptional regulator